MVYVLDIAGKPLMPTERHGKVRRLLRDGNAHVVKLMPFTIQLDYESKRFRQEVSLGVDTGSVHIGVSATTEKKELFAAEAILRNDIVSKLSTRLEMRRGRRLRKMRYREKRFSNRRIRKGWFPPSVSYKIRCHLNVIGMVFEIIPISSVYIEIGQFDFQKLKCDNEDSKLGFWNIREYILSRDKHKCQHCKGKSGDKILNVHHIESRKTGGNAPNNLVTLCETCHKALHRGEFELKVKRGKSLRDAAFMNIMRLAVYNNAKMVFGNVSKTYGYITKYSRSKHNIPKTHCSDAFCISRNFMAVRQNTYFTCRMIQRHSRSLHVCNPRRGGQRRSTVSTHWLGKSKLQRYDTVIWNGITCFIYGSTHGRPVLKDIYGNRITPTADVNAKTVKFLKKNNKMLIYKSKYS